jgi:hypothetical protein
MVLGAEPHITVISISAINIKQLNLNEKSEKSIEEQQQQDKTKFIQKEKKK